MVTEMCHGRQETSIRTKCFQKGLPPLPGGTQAESPELALNYRSKQGPVSKLGPLLRGEAVSRPSHGGIGT